MRKKNIYLDYAATTPLKSIAEKAMRPYETLYFANPESVHEAGQEAARQVIHAREIVSAALHASFRGLIFTASATEANNIFLQGAVRKFRKEFPSRIPKIIISSLEHSSVRAVTEYFLSEGGEVVVLPRNIQGNIDMDSLVRALDERVVFVSVIHGNNEIGFIHPVEEIGFAVKSFRGNQSFPLFHTDAVQTFPYMRVGLEHMNADGITVSAHKMGGPKGVAALAFREGCISPIFFGGGQEFELRPGTHNVPAIVGFSAVVEENEKQKEKNAKKVSAVKEKFWKTLKKEIPHAERNEIGGKKNAFLPHILSFRVRGATAEEIIIALSLQGIFISAGSACSARHTSVPRAVRALWGEERAKESVRVSFSPTTTSAEIMGAVRALKGILKK